MILTLAALFLVGDFAFFLRMIRYMDTLPLEVGDELIVQLLNVVFLTLFMMVLFSSVISSLTIFYMSRDLEFLHSLPTTKDSILTLKFWQSVLQSSWMVWLFGVPIFMAYGYHFQTTPGYYAYLIFSFIPFAIIPCILGSLGIMALMRYFPAKRTHQILTFLGLMFLVGLVVYIRFLSPEKFFRDDVSDEMIMAFVDSLRAPQYDFLPSSWITRGLIEWKAGNFEIAYVRLAWLLICAGVLFAGFRRISERIYFSSWRAAQEINGAPQSNTAVKFKNGPAASRFSIPAAENALLMKDVKLFFRDPGQWSQLFILFALVVVYIFNIMNLPLSNLVLKNVVSVLNIGMVGFVLSALISRFVFSAVSIEGNMMWTVYTAPVKMGRFLFGKFILYFPPLLIVAEILVVSSNYLLQVDSYVMRMSMSGVFLITLGLVGMGVGLGAMYPMFRHENISEISTSAGGIIFMILSLMYVGAVVALGARPMYVHFNEIFLLKSVGGVDVPICYGLIILLTGVVIVEPLRRGVKNLETMDL